MLTGLGHSASRTHNRGEREEPIATRTPTTRAIIALREAGVDYEPAPYRYEERGGTRVSARELGVDEHAVIKTLVMEDETRAPLLVLMHGDRQVSTKRLARQLERKSVTPCHPRIAEMHTGYKVGGTSPFGTKKPLPLFVEATIFDLPRVWINGGARGFLVSLAPEVLDAVFSPTWVEVGLAR